MATNDKQALLQAWLEGKISRRDFLVGALALGFSVGAGTFLGSPVRAQSAATTLSLWHGWTGADNTTALNDVLTLFDKQNSLGLTIEPTAFEWDTLFSKWVISAASGGAPDLVLHHVSEIPEFAKRGMTVPIGDLVREANLDISDVPAAVLGASQWQGQLYAVPGDVHPLGMYYNLDMVNAAGLDPDQPPTTRDAFLDWTQKLTITDASGSVTQYGVDLPTTGAIPRWLWFSLLHQFGGSFLDEQGKTAVDSEASQQALQFLVDLIYDHKVANQGTGGLSGNDAFAAKQVAIRFIGPWEVNLRMSQGLNFATAPLPVVGSQPATWGNAHCMSIPKQRNTDKYQDNMAFITWFYENYAIPAKTVGIIPLSPAARSSPTFTDDARYAYYKAFIKELPYVVFEPSLPQYTQIFSFAKPTPLSINLEAALSRSKTVEQALVDMKAGIDDQLAQP